MASKTREGQLTEYRRQIPAIIAFPDGYEEVIEARFKDASVDRGRHSSSMEARLEVCLLELSGLCQFTAAESARFLIVLDLAIEEAREEALDRHTDGLLNDVIPSLARSILHHSSRRQRSKA